MAVKRGRPPKSKKEDKVEEKVETKVEEVSKENETKAEDTDSTMDEIKEFMQPSEPSDAIFNPLKEDVVEREYSTPKIAEGIVEDLDEPIFQQQTYQDLTDMSDDFEESDPLQDPNPALHDLSDKDKKQSSEYLADATLSAYAMLLKFGSGMVKVSDSQLQKKAEKYNVDLNDRISVDGVNQVSVTEFMQYYNEEIDRAMAYDPAFGKEAKPLLVEIYSKKGWGLTPEQKLMLLFASDIGSKLVVASQLSRQIDEAFKMKGQNPSVVAKVDDDLREEAEKEEEKKDEKVDEVSTPSLEVEEIIPSDVDDITQSIRGKQVIDFDNNPLRETKRTMHTHAKAPKVTKVSKKK